MDKIKFQFTNLLFTFTSLVAIFLASMTAAAIEGLPAQPTDPAHPGSAIAPYEVERADFVLDGRSVEVFLPKSATGPQKYPLIVFGHGQALGVEHYRRTLEHLARKGVVAIHPQFDTGFFDRNWRRMADDYNRLTAEALSRYANFIAADQIVYSGHSKGAYVALVAAGAPSRSANPPKALILFEPAGYDAEYIQQMDVKTPVTLTWADGDTITPATLIHEIYEKLPTQYKQLIQVSSYAATEPELVADHFFMLTKSSVVGGRTGVSPFHYFGGWKWLLGSAWDLQSGGGLTNAYVYGAETDSTGISILKHHVLKSW
mgnify:CR=1 FL=1